MERKSSVRNSKESHNPEKGFLILPTELIEQNGDRLKEIVFAYAKKWELREVTTDLHADGQRGLLTDYEMRFMQEGVPICRLVAVRTAETLDGSAGVPPRLRDAALSDARGYRAPESEKKENDG